MDLNYLFHRQQVERSRAEDAGSDEAKQAHEQLAQRYEAAIDAATDGPTLFQPPAETAPDGSVPDDRADPSG